MVNTFRGETVDVEFKEKKSRISYVTRTQMCQQDLNCEKGRGAVHLIHWKTDLVQTVTKSSILISNAPNRTSQATKI